MFINFYKVTKSTGNPGVTEFRYSDAYGNRIVATVHHGKNTVSITTKPKSGEGRRYTVSTDRMRDVIEVFDRDGIDASPAAVALAAAADPDDVKESFLAARGDGRPEAKQLARDYLRSLVKGVQIDEPVERPFE